MIVNFPGLFLPYPFFEELALPGNSNLGLRSSLPFLTSLALLVAFQLFGKNPKIFFCIIGCLIGIQPLWSNDYGIPSCLALTTVIIIYLIKKNRKSIVYKSLIVFFSAFIAFFVSAYVLTGGHPINWIRDNFYGISRDQFWYFGWSGEKVFSLIDIFINAFPWQGFLYFYIASILLILLYLIFKNFQVKKLLLLYVAITVLGAGIISSIGGTNNPRYYAPTRLVSCFIIPLSLYLLFSNLISHYKFNYLRTILWRFDEVNFNKKIYFFALISLFIFYTITPIIHGIKLSSIRANIFNNDNFFYVEELGGWLSKPWKHSVQLGRRIKEELRNELPNQRLLSTYSSSLDLIAGAKNPTGVDYIIHALGDKARANYLGKLKRLDPKYITTLREDFTNWETWVRRTNWWFYREFFQNYEPVEATFYNIIWRHIKQPKNINYPKLMCHLIQERDNQVNLIIDTEEETDNQRAYYVDIALN